MASQTFRKDRPTTILLIRHGLTPTTGTILPGRAPGLHLSSGGEVQAEGVADRISALGKPERASGRSSQTPPVAIYASPLERATETAKPIARRLGLRVRTDRGLTECDFGEWTGSRLSQLAKKPSWAQVQRHPSGFRFPGGESFLEMQSRMVETVGHLVDRHPGAIIVAVSHADPIKAAVAAAAGIHLDLFQRLVVQPCSVSAITHTEGGPHVLCVNSTTSLTELAIA